MRSMGTRRKAMWRRKATREEQEGNGGGAIMQGLSHKARGKTRNATWRIRKAMRRRRKETMEKQECKAVAECYKEMGSIRNLEYI